MWSVLNKQGNMHTTSWLILVLGTFKDFCSLWLTNCTQLDCRDLSLWVMKLGEPLMATHLSTTLPVDFKMSSALKMTQVQCLITWFLVSFSTSLIGDSTKSSTARNIIILVSGIGGVTLVTLLTGFLYYQRYDIVITFAVTGELSNVGCKMVILGIYLRILLFVPLLLCFSLTASNWQEA